MLPFQYVKPRSLKEACALLAENQGGFVLAGGTHLLLRIGRELVRPDVVVDIKNLPGLHEIRFNLDDGLSLGAAVTVRELMADNDVRRHYPLLAEACLQVGSPQIRNRATAGGNVCSANPAADLVPALLCYDALCHVHGPEGERALPLVEFYGEGGGTVLRSGEILAGIVLPTPWADAAGVYQTVRQGKGGHRTLAGVAVYANAVDGELADWRLSVAAAGPRTFRALAAEALLSGSTPSPQKVQEAAELAMAAADPLDDVQAGSAYRRAMVGVLARRGIEAVAAQLGKGA